MQTWYQRPVPPALSGAVAVAAGVGVAAEEGTAGSPSSKCGRASKSPSAGAPKPPPSATRAPARRRPRASPTGTTSLGRFTPGLGSKGGVDAIQMSRSAAALMEVMSLFTVRVYTRICSAHQRPMFRVFVDERGRQVCEPGCVQGAPSSPSCTGADDTRWVPGGWLGPGGGGGQQESDKRCVHLWRRLQLGHNNTHTRPVDPSAPALGPALDIAPFHHSQTCVLML
jgi:hypothetical protein